MPIDDAESLLSVLLMGSIREELEEIGGSHRSEFTIEACGEARVIRTDEALCLHFDDLSVHTLMSIKDPYKLCLTYTQAMMGFKLFKPCPEHILVVGLGGGSLSKYCYRRFPQARISSVEISDDIISLRKTFHIPDDDDRFRVLRVDAADYLATTHDRPDVILLDGYSREGLPASLSSRAFYDLCHARLADDGLLVVNLHGTDARFEPVLISLLDAFAFNCLIGKADRSLNHIVIAHKGDRTLKEGIQTDIRRLMTKSARGVTIPYFEPLLSFL